MLFFMNTFCVLSFTFDAKALLLPDYKLWGEGAARIFFVSQFGLCRCHRCYGDCQEHRPRLRSFDPRGLVAHVVFAEAQPSLPIALRPESSYVLLLISSYIRVNKDSHAHVVHHEHVDLQFGRASPPDPDSGWKEEEQSLSTHKSGTWRKGGLNVSAERGPGKEGDDDGGSTGRESSG